MNRIDDLPLRMSRIIRMFLYLQQCDDKHPPSTHCTRSPCDGFPDGWPFLQMLVVSGHLILPEEHPCHPPSAQGSNLSQISDFGDIRLRDTRSRKTHVRQRSFAVFSQQLLHSGRSFEAGSSGHRGSRPDGRQGIPSSQRSAFEMHRRTPSGQPPRSSRASRHQTRHGYPLMQKRLRILEANCVNTVPDITSVNDSTIRVRNRF